VIGALAGGGELVSRSKKEGSGDISELTHSEERVQETKVKSVQENGNSFDKSEIVIRGGSYE